MAERVLVIDDEERIRKLLIMYLEKEGYIVDLAKNNNKSNSFGVRRTSVSSTITLCEFTSIINPGKTNTSFVYNSGV